MTPKDAVATRRRSRYEAREPQGEPALRRLHPRLDRARLGARVQLARQPAGSIRSLHQEPGPRRLEADADRYDDGGFSTGARSSPSHATFNPKPPPPDPS